MQLFYPKNGKVKLLACFLLSAGFLLSASGRLAAQTKDSTVTSIYTDFKTYWKSSTTSISTIQPDSSHNLLAFTFRGKTYSTGVNDAILNIKLGSANYKKGGYKALPIKNISGNVPVNTITGIATGIKNDGDSTKAAYAKPYPAIRMADVLTDGINGLDLGTGVLNLPKGGYISFAINLGVKASTDTDPDLIFTQIASTTASSFPDTIYFYDGSGKLVGNKKLVYWNNGKVVGLNKVDLYTLATGVPSNTSTINNVYLQNATANIRMLAFLVTEFGITNADSAAKVKGIMIQPGSINDPAFIAYNTKMFDFERPVITRSPASQLLCNSTASSATFTVTASSDIAMTYQWKKNGAVISGATSSSYTATGLTLADTVNAYSVTVTNTAGSVTSENAYIKYITQPSNQYVATGAPATFAVNAPGATAFQWYKNGVAIPGAGSATYTIPAATLNLSGSSYYVVVTSSNGNCTSNTATLTVENLPVITSQPVSRAFCTTSTAAASFSVTATSTSALSYQWQKNGVAIPGAVTSSYTATGLTVNDTANTYRVVVTNKVGSTTSNEVNFKYVIIAQPSPASAYLATGNAVTFTATASAVATAFQWKKDGTAINGATGSSYIIGAVNSSDAGNYTLEIAYQGGTCTSNANVLTTSTILYSKGEGDLGNTVTWGVAPDGSGSTPVDFTRTEHTFIVANRAIANTAANIAIAGTLDIANAKVVITPGTTLEAGRITRSLNGTLAGSATSSLAVHGASHLYFDNAANVLQTLSVNTTDTVKLHTSLNITAGSARGIVVVDAGNFDTGDSLTLKSDAFGTAGIGNSAGTITGKVTVERYIPARRAWRLFSAPVAKTGAPTINAAWQEGATNTLDNPHPGYGTHITYGLESGGFDQNPSKSFSMQVYNGTAWKGVPATKNTLVTDYIAYMLFVRGDRSYNIKSSKDTMLPMPTILRTTGTVNQGTQPAIPVSASGFTLIGNPYASPVNFEKIYQHSSNLAHQFRIWNPMLGGSSGVGAYVVVYWDGNDYSTVPNIGSGSALRNIQANQGFFVESNGNPASISFMESDKDTVNTTIPFGRSSRQNRYTSTLNVNLKEFNSNNTTSIIDGIAYLFNNDADTDGIRAGKIANAYENLGIVSGNNLLTVEQRSIPVANDSLHLSVTGTKTTSYQFEVVSGPLDNVNMYLYDRYEDTLLPIRMADTSRFTISVNTSIPASKASDRFTIVVKDAPALPVTFTRFNAYTKGQAVQVDWNVKNEGSTRYYEVEKACNDNNFQSISQVAATGSSDYSFTDAVPCSGDNYYRIKSVSVTGAVSYTQIANVAAGGVKPSIAVYPNPLTSNHLLLQMKNQPAGKYQLILTSTTGQVVYTGSIMYNGTATMQPVHLPASLANGVYQLQVVNNGNKEVIKILCNY